MPPHQNYENTPDPAIDKWISFRTNAHLYKPISLQRMATICICGVVVPFVLYCTLVNSQLKYDAKIGRKHEKQLFEDWIVRNVLSIGDRFIGNK